MSPFSWLLLVFIQQNLRAPAPLHCTNRFNINCSHLVRVTLKREAESALKMMVYFHFSIFIIMLSGFCHGWKTQRPEGENHMHLLLWWNVGTSTCWWLGDNDKNQPNIISMSVFNEISKPSLISYTLLRPTTIKEFSLTSLSSSYIQ